MQEISYAMLAQLDRAFVYGTKGQGFESLASHQKFFRKNGDLYSLFFLLLHFLF